MLTLTACKIDSILWILVEVALLCLLKCFLQQIDMYDSHVFDLFQDTIEEDNSSIVDKILGIRMRKADKDVSSSHNLQLWGIKIDDVRVHNCDWWVVDIGSHMFCSDFQISVDGETEEQSTSNEEVEEFFVKYKNLWVIVVSFTLFYEFDLYSVSIYMYMYLKFSFRAKQ